MIASIKEKLQPYKHFYILFYYIVILMLYNLYEKMTIPKYIMYSKIDDYIPFVKEMVIPYLFWYVYIIITLIYTGFTSKKDFYNFSIFMFSGMTICFLIYAIFPNGQNLRPTIHTTDIFSRMVYYIYSCDTPTNSAPSMHVLDAVAVHIALCKCSTLYKNYWVKISSFITMALIIASTVMIKQHSIVDVMYGFLLSGFLYILIYRLNMTERFLPEDILIHTENGL